MFAFVFLQSMARVVFVAGPWYVCWCLKFSFINYTPCVTFIPFSVINLTRLISKLIIKIILEQLLNIILLLSSYIYYSLWIVSTVIDSYMMNCIYFRLYVVKCCTFSPFPTFPFCHALLITNSFISIYYMLCYEQFIISYQLCTHINSHITIAGKSFFGDISVLSLFVLCMCCFTAHAILNYDNG